MSNRVVSHRPFALTPKLCLLIHVCLYPDTLFIDHKWCRMLSILNELTLQNDLQHCMTNNVVDKKTYTHTHARTHTHTHTHTHTSKQKILAIVGNLTRALQSGALQIDQHSFFKCYILTCRDNHFIIYHFFFHN